MNAVTLGPLVLAVDHYSAILGIFAFILVTGMLTRRIDSRFHAWSSWVLIGGGAAARAGHVLLHWRNFAEEPLRILAFWDGGFYWPAGLAAALLSILLALRTARLRLWALLPLALLWWCGTRPGSSPAVRRQLHFPPRVSNRWREKNRR